MTELELAYVAGVIDGEGTITSQLYESQFTPRMSISNTNLNLIKWLINKLQAGHLGEKDQGDNRKLVYRLDFRLQEILPLLNNVKDYLRLKQKQTDLVLMLFDTKDKSIKSLIHNEITVLNQAGVNGYIHENIFDKSNLDDITKSYMAGIVDGEGTIGIGKNTKKNSISYIPTVQVTNTCFPLLYWLRETTKLGQIETKQRYERSKIIGRWWLRVNELKSFIGMIKPYLVIKSEQADLILEYLDLGKENYFVDYKTQLQREILFTLTQELNKRGV